MHNVVRDDGTIVVDAASMRVLMDTLAKAIKRAYDAGINQHYWRGYTNDVAYIRMEETLREMEARTTAATLGLRFEDWSK